MRKTFAIMGTREPNIIDDAEASMSLDKNVPTLQNNTITVPELSVNESAALRHAGEVIPGLWVGDIRSVSCIDDLVQISTSRCRGPNQNDQARGRAVTITVISIMSNENLIKYVADLLEQKQKHYLDKQQVQNEQQHEHGEVECYSSSMKDKCCKKDILKHAENVSVNEKIGHPILSTENIIPSTTNNITIRHIKVRLRDSIDADLMGELNKTSTLIDQALGNFSFPLPKYNTTTSDQNDNSIGVSSTKDGVGSTKDKEVNMMCLVHCAKGASRSVSVVIGYLLSRYPGRFQSFSEALEHVRTVRPQAMPNVKFAIDLRKYASEMINN